MAPTLEPTAGLPGTAAPKKWWQKINWPLLIAAASLLFVAYNTWATRLKDSQDLRMSPIESDVAYMTTPSQVGFVITNVGNRQAVLIHAHLAFWDPSATVNTRFGHGQGAVVFEPGWEGTEDTRLGLPRSIDPDETVVLQLAIPRAVSRKPTNELALITTAASRSGETFGASAKVGVVGALDESSRVYTKLLAIRKYSLQLLSNASIGRQ